MVGQPHIYARWMASNTVYYSNSTPMFFIVALRVEVQLVSGPTPPFVKRVTRAGRRMTDAIGPRTISGRVSSARTVCTGVYSTVRMYLSVCICAPEHVTTERSRECECAYVCVCARAQSQARARKVKVHRSLSTKPLTRASRPIDNPPHDHNGCIYVRSRPPDPQNVYLPLSGQAYLACNI